MAQGLGDQVHSKCYVNSGVTVSASQSFAGRTLLFLEMCIMHLETFVSLSSRGKFIFFTLDLERLAPEELVEGLHVSLLRKFGQRV